MNKRLEPANSWVFSHSETGLFCEVAEEGESNTPGEKKSDWCLGEARRSWEAGGQRPEHPQAPGGFSERRPHFLTLFKRHSHSETSCERVPASSELCVLGEGQKA